MAAQVEPGCLELAFGQVGPLARLAGGSCLLSKQSRTPAPRAARVGLQPLQRLRRPGAHGDHRGERPHGRHELEVVLVQPLATTGVEVGQGDEGAATASLLLQPSHILGQALDAAPPVAHGQVARVHLGDEPGPRPVHVGRQQGDPVPRHVVLDHAPLLGPPAVGHERRVELHGEAVAHPRGLVADQRVGGGMGFVEAVLREIHYVIEKI